MTLFRSTFFSAWICITTLIFLGVSDPLFDGGRVKNPAWRNRSRHIFVKRWSYGLRNLHLSSQDQWPDILKPSPSAGPISKRELVGEGEFEQLVPSTHHPTLPAREEVLLPLMDESVVNELSQPNMPTFQEFHAKVLCENQNKRRLDNRDEPVSGTLGQSVKGGAADSNLSKSPNRTDEISFHASISSTAVFSSADTSVNPAANSEGGGTTINGAHFSDIIHPSSVSENGGNNAGGGKSCGGGCEGQELRVMRNIAASECGAKLLQASPAAKYPHSVLVDNNDEYMNQPCSSEKWFIIETCEPVQLGTIQIANYELFSSRYKTFRVYGSDRYPAKQWEQIGTFQAQDVKGLQTFRVSDAADGRLIKYVKFEILDHYGSEHFCPITMVRLFGLSSDDLDDPVPSIQQATQAPTASTNAVHQSSSSVDEAILEGMVSELHGVSNTSNLTTSNSEAFKETIMSSSLNASIPERSKQLPADPPLNFNSTTNEAKNEVFSVEQKPAAKLTSSSDRSTGLWQHATRFVMSIIQSAIGGKSSSAHLHTSIASPSSPISDSIDTTDLTSDDFYSVIYIFSSQPTTLPPTTEPRSRGLWHLARCLLTLQDSTPTREVFTSPWHRVWADCKSAAYFLDLPLSSRETLPQLAKLASAYKNLTTVFGKWPDDAGLTIMRSEKFINGVLPLPEFFRMRKDPLFWEKSNPVAEESKSSKQTDILQRESVVLAEPPAQDSPSQAQITPSSLSPSTTTQTQEVEQGSSSRTSPEKSNNLAQSYSNVQSAPAEFQEQETVFLEGGREVVLPAAMGGSWKEAMYMRLNNKVLQLQSDVSVSMRYLEELSQSYKRQTERLSASFNITTAWLKATAKGAEGRDLHQQERIDALEVQLTKLLYILAEQGLVSVENPSPMNRSSSVAHSSVPDFQRPFPTSPTSGVNLQSILWSVFFQSPALTASIQKSSKRQTFEVPTSLLNTAASMTNNNLGERIAFNTTTVLPMAKTLVQSSVVASTAKQNVRMSPQASLLLHGRRQGRHHVKTKLKKTESTRLLDDVEWKFILVVAARHLRNCILSETFQLWLLHVLFAAMAQIFVYLVFLRRALQRWVLSVSPPSSLSPVCRRMCPYFDSTSPAAISTDIGGCTNIKDSLSLTSPSKALVEHFVHLKREEIFAPSSSLTKEEAKLFDEFTSNVTAFDYDDPNRIIRQRKLSAKLEDMKMEEQELDQTESLPLLVNWKSVIQPLNAIDTQCQSVVTKRVGSRSLRKRQRQKQKQKQ